MKNIASIFLAAFTLFAFSATAVAAKEGHSIKVKVKGLQEGQSLFLANYYGKKQYYTDTVEVSNGVADFKGEEALPGGIYSIVMPNKKSYVEFVVNDQFFEMECDTLDLVKSMKFKGSEENTTFFEYLVFVGNKTKESIPLKEELKKEGLEEKQKKKIKEDLTKIDEEVLAYKKKIYNDHPDWFIGKLLMASTDPEIPEGLDKDKEFKYYKSHYFEYIDFQDDRFIRTPVFHSKLDYYMKKLTVQTPDSIIKAADMLAEKAKGTKDLFKYIVHHVTNTYETSKVMCMDAVFVHMAETYYMTGQAFWLDSAKVAKIADRATTLKPVLCDKVPPNIILQDTTETNWINMLGIEADYTVLFFWDPNCGHCKKSMPKMKRFYEEYKPKGVEVFAVCTEFETKDWKKYVRENELNWINVSDNPEVNKNAYKYLEFTTLKSLNFRDTWDIYSTPVIYILDKNKKIIAKRIGAEQLGDFIDNYSKAKKEDKADKPAKKKEKG